MCCCALHAHTLLTRSIRLERVSNGGEDERASRVLCASHNRGRRLVTPTRHHLRQEIFLLFYSFSSIENLRIFENRTHIFLLSSRNRREFEIFIDF